MLAIRNLNNWAIQELLLVDLAKTQYARDDEGPYFCSYIVILMGFQTISSIDYGQT